MSIDWENLLNASGEDLQDAYERLCDGEWDDMPWDDDPWYDDPPVDDFWADDDSWDDDLFEDDSDDFIESEDDLYEDDPCEDDPPLELTPIPWHIRVAEAAAQVAQDDDLFFELPDFAPEPDDPAVLDEIMEEVSRQAAMDIWELEDDPASTLELDEFGNPILNWAFRCRKAQMMQT